MDIVERGAANLWSQEAISRPNKITYDSKFEITAL